MNRHFVTFPTGNDHMHDPCIDALHSPTDARRFVPGFLHPLVSQLRSNRSAFLPFLLGAPSWSRSDRAQASRRKGDVARHSAHQAGVKRAEGNIPMSKHQPSSQREASRDSPPTGQGPTGRSTSEGLGQRRPSSSLARLPVVGATFPPRSRLLRCRCRGPGWTPRERTRKTVGWATSLPCQTSETQSPGAPRLFCASPRDFFGKRASIES